MLREGKDWKEIFVEHVSAKAPVFRTYKELSKLNNDKYYIVSLTCGI